ncbi:MAG: DUF2140 family protein [Planctomycetaceae bacterium]
MIKKLIKRTLLVGAALAVAAILCAIVCIYLAFQQPDFYAELRTSEPAPTQNEDVEQRVANLEEWARKSLSLQRAKKRGENNKAAQEYDPQTDTFSLRLSQSELNAELNSKSDGDVREPRIRLMENQIQVGAEIAANEKQVVFSVDLQPTVTPNSTLELDIQGARIGKLPLPLNWLLSFVGDKKLSNKVRLGMSGERPVFAVDLFKDERRSARVKSIKTSPGEITIEFLAPQLKK